MAVASRVLFLLLASAPSALACDLFAEIQCDTQWTATIAGNDKAFYDCNSWTYDGDDMAVWLVPPEDTLVRFDLRPGAWSNDPDLMVSNDGCDGACVTSSENFGTAERVDFYADGGETYVFHIDDFFYYDGIFLYGTGYNVEFDVWCAEGTCDPFLDTQGDLSCSTSQSGGTPASVGNELKYYDCPDAQVAGYDPLWQTGPEAIYTFSPQTTGPVTFQLSNMSNDQDLYVLADSCDPDSCIAASTFESTLTDSVTFDAVAGHTYYIVVEGYEGPGTYDLDFDIGFGGCPEDCANGLDDDDDGAIDCSDTDCWGEPECGCDNDGDGVDGPVCGGPDCDDADPLVYPGAPERCNDIDDDCDTQVDEGLASQTWYYDNDSDGFGGGTTVVDCAAPSRYVAQGGDCVDGNASIFPGAQEVCNGVDDNCNNVVDDGITVPTWYLDGDGDTWGGSTSTQSCNQPAGYVSRGGDCADSNNGVHPGRTEVCNSIDDNCSGQIDEGLATFPFYADGDGDQYGAGAAVQACRAPAGHVSAAGDCVDTNPAIHPNATEICDDIDQDCDGIADDGIATQVWYADGDGDTWGGSTSVTDCAAPTGYVGRGGDCVDSNPAIHPAATDGCDGIDNDCDGEQDEDGDQAVWYADGDGDGYGGTTSVQQCAAPTGYVGQGGDCLDSNGAVNPGAREVCNGIDDDCDTLIDDADPTVDASSGTTWHVDDDGDGYGGSVAVLRCEQPDDAVSNTDDCDDRAADRFPGNPEVCDGRDNNCDGVPDETTSCFDDDGDGATEDGGDCDDSNPAIGPHSREICDGIDQDCDGLIDEGTPCFDDDDDGYTEDEGDCHDADSTVSPAASEVEGDGIDNDCDGSVDGGSYDPDGDGFSERGGDCVEGDAQAHPGAPERANGQDDDCDGIVDEGTTLYDDDGDGVTEDEGDCNDADAQIHPGASETDNGVDDDCDGIVDNGIDTVDDDGDGLSEAEGDCDDTDASVLPGASEANNGVDDDCDGHIDEDFLDLDRDGMTTLEGDCDDTNGWIRPGRADLCDGLDNDCNGTVDDGCDDTTPLPTATRCGCSSSSTGWLGLWPLAGLALVFRRRRAVALAAVAAAGCKNDTDISGIDGTVSVLPLVSDAGVVAVGSEMTVDIEVLHLRGPAVEVRAVDVFNVDGEMFRLTGELPTVQDRESGVIELTYAPTEAGYHRAAITVVTSEGDAGEVSVRGQAVLAGGGIIPRLVDFGVVAAGQTETVAVSVLNDSELDWTLNGIELSGPFGVDTALPLAVPAGSSVPLTLSFTPTDAEPAVLTAELVATAPDLPSLTLRGNACEGGAPAAYDTDGDGITSCGGDCDDTVASTHPGAAEVPDSLDNDCDGTIDEGTVAYDDDGDGTSENDGDCNDASTAVGPDVNEIFGNGLDDDCDGVIDQGTTDGDADGVSIGGGDCDDTRADVRPGAIERADGLDNDCDGTIDEGTARYDDDGDGYCESVLSACSDGSISGDCDDSTNTVHPTRPETADGRDNDCDGLIDEGTVASDDDGDSFTELGGDCDDTRPDVSPAHREVPGNGRDDDCDPATAD